MSSYTFRDLLAALKELSDEDLGLTATVYNASIDEFYPIVHTDRASRVDVLDSDHPYIVIGCPKNHEETLQQAWVVESNRRHRGGKE